MKNWHLESGKIDEVVKAKDQFDAFDALRDRDKFDFGLIVWARPAGGSEDDQIPVRTSMLMRRWWRDDDAEEFVRRGIAIGMPDTTAADMQAVGR